MNEENVKNFEKGKKVAVVAGGIVYVGVVLLFTSYYENLMTSQFDTGILAVISRIGAFFVSLNLLALPLALHYWAVTKGHRIVASIFYGLDIIIMGLNMIAAASMNGVDVAPWIIQYQTYSPASIIFILAGWSLLYITDPGHTSLVKLQEALTDAKIAIIEGVREHVKSDEGVRTIIQPFSAKLAAKVLSQRSLIGEYQALPVSPVEQENTGDLQTSFKDILEKAGFNGKSDQLSKELMDAIAGNTGETVNPTNASTKKK